MAAPIVHRTGSPSHSKKPRMHSYHPLFSDPEADVVLRSLDNTLFRVYSHTLKSTSDLFRTMFSLPQSGHREHEKMEDHENDGSPRHSIPVYESEETLTTLLKMISGMPVPQWTSYDDVERVLDLAEKWDTPGPISAIRSAISAPHFLSDPLRLYRIATHFEWEDIAQLAATATLSLYIYDPAYEPALSELSSKFLSPLLSLHRQRRELFKISIDSPARFTAGNVDPFYCGSCNTPIDNSTWRALKGKMYNVMDRRPSGECFFSVVDVDQWEEALACWEAKCSTKSCGALNYDKAATLRQIKSCIALLPNTVELDWT